MFDIDWKGLAVPFAYLLVLGGALMTFSSIYRRRKASQSANLAPWFGPNVQRNIYLSLLHMQPEEGGEKTPRIPDSVLRAALLRRAVEDIQRLIQLKSAKQACTNLLQRGSVGDDLWQRFQRAEKEMEEELRDVVQEANALCPNWGQFIFQSANEISNNAKLRKTVSDIQSTVDSEREWWDKRKGQNHSELLKELEEPDKAASSQAPSSTTPSVAASEEDAVLVDSPGKGGKKKKGKK